MHGFAWLSHSCSKVALGNKHKKEKYGMRMQKHSNNTQISSDIQNNLVHHYHRFLLCTEVELLWPDFIIGVLPVSFPFFNALILQVHLWDRSSLCADGAADTEEDERDCWLASWRGWWDLLTRWEQSHCWLKTVLNSTITFPLEMRIILTSPWTSVSDNSFSLNCSMAWHW